jgi:ABC-type amino acid transport substrate-binding protein
MKRNYWVGGFVIVVILFLNSPGLTQQTENRSNQGGVNESQPNYVIGLRTNAAPISYRDSDNSDNSDNFKGYCHAFLETLKQKKLGDIKTVSVSRGKRFTGQGDNGEKLDALCGPDTITTGRGTKELQEKELDGKFSNPFAWTSIAVLLKKKNQDNFLHPTLEQELKIGVLSGTTTKDAVKALYPSLVLRNQIYYSNDFKEALSKLQDEKIIAYFDDEILLRGRLQKISSTNPEKEYVILPIPSIIEYGIVIFHTKDKNQKLLQAINNLLSNAQQEKFDSTTIKILENNQDFQNFISSVKQKIPEDNLIKPSPSPPSPGFNWLLVFSVIIIIGVIIWLSFHIRAITNYTSQQKQNPELSKTILILVANPKTTSRLRLDEEVREIDTGLQRAKKRELFDLKQRWAVRVQDVYQSLLDLKPQIVHFSGHGTEDDGLQLEDETGKMRLVDTAALAKLFELFASNIECVVLNACYSEVQASAIAQHIPYVIGMNKAIGDKAAIKFATGFYSALCAGESVEFAYKLGCNVIQLDGIPEHLTPVLKKK